VKKSVDKLDVHYQLLGQGPPVFLLHGWGSNLSLFSAIAEVISQKYTAISLDLPGFGQSPEPDQPWGMDEYLEFTAKFIDCFEAESVIVLGHSHGGRIGIRLATEVGLPFTVSKLILVDSAGIIPKRGFGYHLKVRTYKVGKAILKSVLVAKLFPNGLASFQKKMGSSDYTQASPTMRASLVKVVNADLEPLLSKITAETLLIWGENDDETPLKDGQLMEQAIPGAGLVVLPNAGHYSFLDQAFRFRRVIESFLDIP